MGENSTKRGLGQSMKYFVQGLSKKQLHVLKALGPHMAPKGFYLAGGTALAIHYGHRFQLIDPLPRPFPPRGEGSLE